MTYQFHEQYNPELCDQFVMQSTQNTLFQCSNWAKVKNNWNAYFTCVTEGETILATGLVLERELILGQKLFYLPRGPVLDYENKELLEFYFAELKKFAKAHHAAAIRFDPAILSKCYPYKEHDSEHLHKNDDIIATLEALGAKHKGFTVRIEESTQPRFNAEMDLIPDYEEKLEHRTRKCIRGAIHKGIFTREGKEYLDDFAKAMHYTEVRKKVALRNESYFEHMLEVYGDQAICMVAYLNFPKQLEQLKQSLESNQKELSEGNPTKKRKAELERLIAQDEKEIAQLQKDYEKEGQDEIVTSGILACYNAHLMELFYMGNHPDYMRMYSSYLLYKKCLDRCLELSIPKCSFGGIEGTLDDGLTLFKSNWLMNVEEYIGEFNIILNPIIYRLFDQLYPKVLKMVAKMRGNA
ncbi:MAG: peptidoglycan bridge formation glycyltransferase FemA/FemB family protein [Solobacterium sp.]|nr:peptidoglycan bridge formation glycyltransferase FemA/FemB family protein [Solobacterium sp.]